MQEEPMAQSLDNDPAERVYRVVACGMPACVVAFLVAHFFEASPSLTFLLKVGVTACAVGLQWTAYLCASKFQSARVERLWVTAGAERGNAAPIGNKMKRYAKIGVFLFAIFVAVCLQYGDRMPIALQDFLLLLVFASGLVLPRHIDAIYDKTAWDLQTAYTLTTRPLGHRGIGITVCLMLSGSMVHVSLSRFRLNEILLSAGLLCIALLLTAAALNLAKTRATRDVLRINGETVSYQSGKSFTEVPLKSIDEIRTVEEGHPSRAGTTPEYIQIIYADERGQQKGLVVYMRFGPDMGDISRLLKSKKRNLRSRKEAPTL